MHLTLYCRFRWNNMQQQEKVQLKDCAMQLLSTVGVGEW